MKDFVQPVLDLIKTLVQPQQGTKFLITIVGLAALYFMHKQGVATTSSDIVIVYYVADIYHKGNKEKPK
jgi:hypothetical protein